MSLESWKQEFYPISAQALTLDHDIYPVPDLTLVEHDLRKWQGFTPENLAKHEITRRDIYSAALTGSEACALCQVHVLGGTWEDCGTCPFVTVTGHTCGAPCDEYYDNGNPNLVIETLVHIQTTLKTKALGG